MITNFWKVDICRNFCQDAKLLAKVARRESPNPSTRWLLSSGWEGKDGGSGGEAQSDSQAAWRQLHLPPITAHLATWTHLICRWKRGRWKNIQTQPLVFSNWIQNKGKNFDKSGTKLQISSSFKVRPQSWAKCFALELLLFFVYMVYIICMQCIVFM